MNKSKKIIALSILITMLFSVVQVISIAAESVPNPIIVDGETKELDLKENFSAVGCDAAIWAKNNATLTINGTDETEVHGMLCAGKICGDEDCGYATTVWAKNSSKIIITGGYYTNESDNVSNDKEHVDLIYAGENSEILITGGTFKCETPRWTLNCKDNTNSTITVAGGRFYKFDPSNTNVTPADAEEIEVKVAEGCRVIKDNDWYVVVKENKNKLYTNKVVETLNLSGEFAASGCDAAIYVNDSSTLTINGKDTDKVHGMLCAGQSCGKLTCGYATTVWANNKSKIEINGGYYTNALDTISNDKEHVDLIYAGNDSHIVINDGIFKCATPKWTLNCKDGTNATITVNGGRYYQLDPSKTDVAKEGTVEIIMGENKEVIQDGQWYEVIEAHSKYTVHEAKEASYTESGNIYYVSCDVCGKYFADKDAKTEITDKDSVVIKKFAEVKEDNAIVTEKAFEEAIKEAGNSSIVIIPAVDTEEKVTSVTVPVNSLKEVANNDKELSITTSEVTATIDNKALEKIISEAGNSEDIKLEIVKIEKDVLNEKQKVAIKDKNINKIISAELLVEGKNITNFGGGKIKLEIPFTLEKDSKGSDYRVIYIADNGSVSEVASKYVDGNMIVELEHFSEYAIIRVAANTPTPNTGSTPAPTPAAPTQTVTTSNPKTGDGIAIYFMILAIAIVGICGIVIIKAKRK